MGSAYQFHSWRVFVLVCAFPSVFAIGALTTQPESPRFYLEVNGVAGVGSRGSCIPLTMVGLLCGCLPSSQGPCSGIFSCFLCLRMYLQRGSVGGETRVPAKPWVA